MPLLVEKPRLSPESKHLLAQHQNLRDDYRWISEEKTLREDYLNQYIAVKNQKVVLADDNVYVLIAKLKAKGVPVDTVAVEYVSEHPDCFLL